jgi:aryl-alcohol dehydrogenase-like predicted oxidoreductase
MQQAAPTTSALPVSKIGLGCVTFGREIDEAASRALLDHAYARGVRHFDTATAYGEGKSESIVGRWLLSCRPPAGTVTIATKILPPYAPGPIATAVEGSLYRLRSRPIDLLYLHKWDATAATPAALAALDAWVRSGKVRALGISNCNRQQLADLLALQREHGFTPISVVQNNQNLAVSDVSEDFRGFCASNQVSIVTYSPLGAGFLTSKHQKGVAPGSRFDLVPGHQNVYFHETAYRRLAKLESVATRSGKSQAHLALAWALHQPDVDTVLVGGRTPSHLDQAFAAREFRDAALLAELTSDGPW